MTHCFKRMMVASFALAMSACVMEMGDGDEDIEETGSSLSEESTLLYSDVGVLAGVLRCPDALRRWILIDNEDRGNVNDRGGWLGWSSSTGNTQFEFCLVNGSLLPKTPQPYMVLALDPNNCPIGMERIVRHFDGENSKPISKTNITTINVLNAGDVTMTFCVHGGGGSPISSFPYLGFEYGVFAAPRFSASLADGFFYTDDEDSSNSNYWIDQFGERSGIGAGRNFWDILNGGSNTGLNVARVR